MTLPAPPPCPCFPEDTQSSALFSLFLGTQILANVFLYLCAIIVGIMSYYMADRKHRKAFLEARQSLEVKMNLEEQSQQQVRLGARQALGEGGLGPGFVLREGVCKKESLLMLWACAGQEPMRPIEVAAAARSLRLSCLPFSIWRRARLSLLSVYWLCSSLIHTEWFPPTPLLPRDSAF